jgi:uncharacterized membrane protein (Fun14 family)
MKKLNIFLHWVKINHVRLMVMLLSIIIGGLLGLSVGYAIKSMKYPPIQIVSINEEALIKEKSLELAKLNLNGIELKKQLVDFKHTLGGLLKALPSHVIVIRSTALFRTDNVLDLTEEFSGILIKPAAEVNP